MGHCEVMQSSGRVMPLWVNVVDRHYCRIVKQDSKFFDSAGRVVCRCLLFASSLFPSPFIEKDLCYGQKEEFKVLVKVP